MLYSTFRHSEFHFAFFFFFFFPQTKKKSFLADPHPPTIGLKPITTNCKITPEQSKVHPHQAHSDSTFRQQQNHPQLLKRLNVPTHLAARPGSPASQDQLGHLETRRSPAATNWDRDKFETVDFLCI
jgi:hypothetical protein